MTRSRLTLSTLCLIPVFFLCPALLAEEPLKLADNPEYAAWAKVPQGTTLWSSNQKVNIMQAPHKSEIVVASVTGQEVVLKSNADAPEGRKIPAKIPAAQLAKDEASAKKSEMKLTDGSTIACRVVLRKQEGQPDTEVHLSAEVPGGVVLREWEEKKHGTIVEKVLAFQLPGKAKREFVKPVPQGAYPIEPEPPSMEGVRKADEKSAKKIEQKNNGDDQQQIRQESLPVMPPKE
jgi:hypothetical protein